jgi:hypothetical protein
MLSDTGDATIGRATVSITSGFAAGEDTLWFTNQNNITGSYDSATGVLTLLGDDTIANYQAALCSAEFSTTDPSVSPAARVVSFPGDRLGQRHQQHRVAHDRRVSAGVSRRGRCRRAEVASSNGSRVAEDGLYPNRPRIALAELEKRPS